MSLSNSSPPLTYRRPGLPTGIVLDENGKPCKVCIPWQTWKNLMKLQDQHHGSNNSKPPSLPQEHKQTTMKPAPAPIPFATPPTLKPKPLKTPLPPGIVLDENGKPCKVCNSWQTWAKIAKKQDRAQSHRDGSTGGEGKSGTGGGSTGTKGMAASMFGAAIGAGATAVKPVEKETSESSSLPEPKRPDDCPPDVNALGRATWTFLHTTAAYYPVRATPEQQSSMRSLIQALGTFYPCSWCAADFRERVKVVEPDVSGRAGLSKWFCDRHNEVNENLGKETFNCDMVMERWKDGPPDGRCD